jgi:putative transposase
MPRSSRTASAGAIFHVVNRGVEKRKVFLDDHDYARFVTLLRDGKERASVKIFGFCLMPNHFHIIISPETDDALGQYMHWVTGKYAIEFRARTETRGHGHVFQWRYWSRGCDDVDAFFIMLRYVEANAQRATLVRRAEDWQWGSLWARRKADMSVIDEPPFELPSYWAALVNRPQFDRELAFARFKPKRGRPCTFPIAKSAEKGTVPLWAETAEIAGMELLRRSAARSDLTERGRHSWPHSI